MLVQHADDSAVASPRTVRSHCALDQLQAQLNQTVEGLPVLTVVAPEGLLDDEVREGILTWSQANEDRVAVVDLGATAPEDATAQQWAQAFADALDAQG